MPDIDSLKHKDTRVNIPTRELDDFVADDEANPKVVEYPGLLYARDPSLDPQLVWKGKDAQDREALAVPAVPIYIQEKIHPQAIIEDLRAAKAKAGAEESLSLFTDFNGIDFEEMIDFYHHQHKWQNRLILSDSLLVMASLAEKEGLRGQVQSTSTRPTAKSAAAAPTTSPAGSSTPTTTARASSSATPTSPAPTSPTKNSAPSAPTSTNLPGPASTRPRAAPSPPQPAERSP